MTKACSLLLKMNCNRIFTAENLGRPLAATKIRSTKSEIRNNIELPKFQCSKQESSHEKAQKAQVDADLTDKNHNNSVFLSKNAKKAPFLVILSNAPQSSKVSGLNPPEAGKIGFDWVCLPGV